MSSKGKEKLKESLSALMDNEANEFEFRRVLKECESNDELKYKWESFHLLSAAIKGELDHTVNADLSIEKGTGNLNEARPSLLARINAELDGAEGSIQPSESYANSDGLNSIKGHQKGIYKLLGQGAIAASVAALVLFTGGTFNPMKTQIIDSQLAGQTEIIDENMTEFDDAYSPSEFSRVPQFNAEFAGTELNDEAARVRLRQAVFQEFVGEPQESVELPVNFNLIIDEAEEE